MLLNGAYLVADEARETFLDQVERLQAEHRPDGLDLRAAGPWPAYNFVPATIGAPA